MSSTLLEQFLREECTPYVRSLLVQASGAIAPARARFEFNHFQVTVDREEGIALVEDVLDATDAGVQRVPLTEFVAALAGRVA